MHEIQIKRIYEAPSADDGYRVLVDRIWPRGVSKEKAKLDKWSKDIGPSNELRKWFGHDPERFTEFADRYREELKEKTEALGEIRAEIMKSKVTLLYGARDTEHNQAVVLQSLLQGRE